MYTKSIGSNNQFYHRTVLCCAVCYIESHKFNVDFRHHCHEHEFEKKILPKPTTDLFENDSLLFNSTQLSVHNSIEKTQSIGTQKLKQRSLLVYVCVMFLFLHTCGFLCLYFTNFKLTCK